MEDRRSNPSKEWNASILGLRNLGYMESIISAATYKGELQRLGVTEDKEREKAEDRVRMQEGWGNNTQSVTKFGL